MSWDAYVYGYLCSWEQGIEHSLATARRTSTKVVALAKQGACLGLIKEYIEKLIINLHTLN